MTRPKETLKSLRWVGSAKKDLSGLPRPVKRKMGFALFLAQTGERHPAAKPLKGFGSAGVLEVVEDFRSDAYRAVYTVRSRVPCTCSTASRRSRPRVRRHRGPTWT